jgi:AcrR family transcriptional regulator
MGQSQKKSRLTREAWLAKALDTLAEDPEHLQVDEIARRLQVSKGSFYWHFENRADFVHALAEYWRDTNTLTVADAARHHVGSPEERLYQLMRRIVEEKAAQYDLAVRAWVRHEPDILPVIREVDAIRFQTVREIFSDIGFEEPDLSVRTRVFVVAHSFDQLLTIGRSREEALEELDARHAFFTRR